MYPHKRRPAFVRRVKVRQLGAVRVRPPRAHKHGLEPGLLCQVGGERGAHGQRVPAQVEVELGGGRLDKRVDLGEGVRADDVDGLQRRWEGRRRGRARSGGEGRVGRGLRVCVGVCGYAVAVAVAVAVVAGGGGGSGSSSGGRRKRGGGGYGLEVPGETG
ncbi:unnamed protein product [Discula destructiva]